MGKRYSKPRTLVSWEFPGGYFFKCALKHITLLSDNDVVSEFKRKFPFYQAVFDAERRLRGKPSAIITDRMIRERADKGRRPGYESEWPNLQPEARVYWKVAKRAVESSRVVSRAQYMQLLQEAEHGALPEAEYGENPEVAELQKRIDALEQRLYVAGLGGHPRPSPPFELPVTLKDLDDDEASREMFGKVRDAVQMAYRQEEMEAPQCDWSIAPSLQILAPECRHYVRCWPAILRHLSIPAGWTANQIATTLAAWGSVGDEPARSPRR